MQQYLELLRTVYTAPPRADRTGVGTTGIFGHQMRFDLRLGFPLLTTKFVSFHNILHELLWFIAGDTNVWYLHSKGVSIWDEWADKDGELGPVYGAQWRRWAGPNGKLVDQLYDVVESIKTNPFSRRHIVTAWQPAELDQMALPPCHCLFQFYVDGAFLSCQLYQRSADVFLGVPYNIASYALLTHMVAQATGYRAGDFIWTGGDTHLYQNHRTQAETQLLRHPVALPTLKINPEATNIFSMQPSDFELINYAHQGKISAPVAV